MVFFIDTPRKIERASIHYGKKSPAPAFVDKIRARCKDSLKLGKFANRSLG